MRIRLMATVTAVVLSTVASPADAVAAPAAWHSVAAPQPGADYRGQARALTATAAFGADDVWSVGSYVDRATDKSEPLILHWTGKAWHRVAAPAHSGSANLRYLCAPRRNALWALGHVSGGPAPHLYLIHDTPAGWRRVGTAGIPGTFVGQSLAVGSASNIWIGGYRTTDHHPAAERWTGSKWVASVLPIFYRSKSGQITSMSMIPGSGRPVAVGSEQWEHGIAAYEAQWTRDDGWVMEPVSTTDGHAYSELNYVKMLSGTVGYATGTTFINNSTSQALLMSGGSDGLRQSNAPIPTGTSTMSAVVTRGTNRMWAAGTDIACGYCAPRAFVVDCNYTAQAEHQGCVVMGQPNPARDAESIDSVLAMTTVPRTHQLWAFGTAGPERGLGQAEHLLTARITESDTQE
jgi:hypothetical protein